MISAVILASSLLLSSGGSGDQVHVLAYHAFLRKNNQYCFSLDELQAQCHRLTKEGYRFITFDDFRQGHYQGKKNVLLTVDDGNRSCYAAFYHVLKPMGIYPLLAIYPAVIGKKKYALTWEQLCRLQRDGCAIAAHGYYHLHLNRKLYLRDPVSFRREIMLSQKILQKKLGITVDVFVYPYGGRCRRTIELVHKAGYRYAFTVEPASVNPGSALDAYQVPRYMLTRHNVTAVFHAMRRRSRAGGVMVAGKAHKVKGGFLKKQGGEVYRAVTVPVLKRPASHEIRRVHEEGFRIALKWEMPDILAHSRQKEKYLYPVESFTREVKATKDEKGEVHASYTLPVGKKIMTSEKDKIQNLLERLRRFYRQKGREHSGLYRSFWQRSGKRFVEIDRNIKGFFPSKK